jgi:hypothetical protein
VPQQVSADEQVVWAQGGVPHTPRLQNGCPPAHLLPQVPQLRMSFLRFTQALPQQPRPSRLLHWLGSQLPPELDALVVPELPVELPAVVVDVAPLVAVVCPPAPPAPLVNTPPPHPRLATAMTIQQGTGLMSESPGG